MMNAVAIENMTAGQESSCRLSGTGNINCNILCAG